MSEFAPAPPVQLKIEEGNQPVEVVIDAEMEDTIDTDAQFIDAGNWNELPNLSLNASQLLEELK
jgi:hypothetical protein